MNHNAHTGFTLIEVLIAIAMIALITTPLFILQGSVLRQVNRLSRRFDELLRAEQFLYQTRRTVPADATEFTASQSVIDPQTTLTYTLDRVSSKSRLSRFENLFVEKVQARWTDQRVRATQSAGVLVYRPQPQPPA